jgi:hypothetical protein
MSHLHVSSPSLLRRLAIMSVAAFGIIVPRGARAQLLHKGRLELRAGGGLAAVGTDYVSGVSYDVEAGLGLTDRIVLGAMLLGYDNEGEVLVSDISLEALGAYAQVSTPKGFYLIGGAGSGDYGHDYITGTHQVIASGGATAAVVGAGYEHHLFGAVRIGLYARYVYFMISDVHDDSWDAPADATLPDHQLGTVHAGVTLGFAPKLW